MRRSGGIRQRVHPQWLQQREQNRHAICCAQGRGLSLVVSAPSQRGDTKQLFTPDGGRSMQDTAPVLQSSDTVGKLGGTNLGSWRTTGASTQESASAAISCTQAEWCASFAQWHDASWDSSQSARPWSRDPECSGTDRSLRINVTLLPRHRKVTTFRSEGLDLRRFKGQTWVCAQRTIFWLSPSVLSSRFPQARCSSRGVSPGANRATHCATWAPVSLRGNDSELDLGSPKTLIPRDEESSEEDRPFLPRFLLQEITHALIKLMGV